MTLFMRKMQTQVPPLCCGSTHDRSHGFEKGFYKDPGQVSFKPVIFFFALVRLIQDFPDGKKPLFTPFTPTLISWECVFRSPGMP